jgi:putative glutamine amidotransferase
MTFQPLIGITAYEKVVSEQPTVAMAGVHVDYKNAVIAAGGIPVLIPQNLDLPGLRTLLSRLDGLLIPGGGDIDPFRYSDTAHPNIRGVDRVRDELEYHAVRLAVEGDLPLLAICRGHQMLNVALGGTLWQDVASEMPAAATHDYYRVGWERDYLAHDVSIQPGSRLSHLLGTTQTAVNSLHHQGVRDVADGLVVVARSADGLPEGMELPGCRFVVSVQWHPENLTNSLPAMQGLFDGLVRAAAGRSQ